MDRASRLTPLEHWQRYLDQQVAHDFRGVLSYMWLRISGEVPTLPPPIGVTEWDGVSEGEDSWEVAWEAAHGDCDIELEVYPDGYRWQATTLDGQASQEGRRDFKRPLDPDLLAWLRRYAEAES